MMNAKTLLEKINRVLKESLEDYNLRLNDNVKIKSIADYGQIGQIVDYDDAKKTVTVEFGSQGERKDFSIEDIEPIEDDVI